MNKGCLLELKGLRRTYAPCRTEYFEGAPRPTKCGVSPHLLANAPGARRPGPSVAPPLVLATGKSMGRARSFFPVAGLPVAGCRGSNLGLIDAPVGYLQAAYPRPISPV